MLNAASVRRIASEHSKRHSTQPKGRNTTNSRGFAIHSNGKYAAVVEVVRLGKHNSRIRRDYQKGNSSKTEKVKTGSLRDYFHPSK